MNNCTFKSETIDQSFESKFKYFEKESLIDTMKREDFHVVQYLLGQGFSSVGNTPIMSAAKLNLQWLVQL